MSLFYPIMNLRLGQAQAPGNVLSPELTSNWLGKIHDSMAQVDQIRTWVKDHPEEAVSVGLDKDAANLPPSSDVGSYPKLAAIVSDLEHSKPIDTTALQCIDNLAAAVKAANEKIAAFQGGFWEFAKSPLGIGLGAGILALGVGLVVLS